MFTATLPFLVFDHDYVHVQRLRLRPRSRFSASTTSTSPSHVYDDGHSREAVGAVIATDRLTVAFTDGATLTVHLASVPDLDVVSGETLRVAVDPLQGNGITSEVVMRRASGDFMAAQMAGP